MTPERSVPVDITLTFTLNTREQRQAVAPGSLLHMVRTGRSGLPIAAAGICLLASRLKPGAASGWAIILTMLGVVILGLPQISLIFAAGTRNRTARRRSLAETRIWVTLTDSRLKYGTDGSVVELAWPRVAHVRTTADCWVISLSGTQTALVIPKRAVPAGMEADVSEFLRLRGTAAGRALAAG